MEPPPPGPARIVLDPEGFEVLPPPRAQVLADGVATAIGLLAIGFTVASVVILASGASCGFYALVFVPGLLRPARARQVLLSLRGARRVRCTPSELVVDRPGGQARYALEGIGGCRSSGAGGVQLDLGWTEEHVEIAASAEQSAWIARAIVLAATRARRIPEPPSRPAELDRLRARER